MACVQVVWVWYWFGCFGVACVEVVWVWHTLGGATCGIGLYVALVWVF